MDAPTREEAKALISLVEGHIGDLQASGRRISESTWLGRIGCDPRILQRVRDGFGITSPSVSKIKRAVQSDRQKLKKVKS